MSDKRVLVNENSLIAIGSAIREKNGTDASYKPGDMATAILEIQTGIEPVGDITITENGEYDVVNYAKAIVEVAGSGGGDIEIPVFTRNCSYLFYYGFWDWAVKTFGNQMRTEDITHAQYMFYSSALTKIPFDINFKPSTSTTSGYIDMSRMFYDCSKLTEIPKMNDVFPENIDSLFYGCNNIRHLPEDFGADWKWDRIHTHKYAGASEVFKSCCSLRNIPSTFMENFYGIATSATYSMYKGTFHNCYNLDEICNLQISSATLTSNCFTNCFNSCANLRKLIFATNEDGTPKTANWKSQTIDLGTTAIGYTDLGGYGYLYNSGRSIEKAIYDDATYAALKNDPDAFVAGFTSENPVNYSKYNRISAVETINSLPDTSAYGTNTIKFKGASGSKTDGGAINTMTEEEIAVAAAKGWTVSFV